MIYIIVWVAVAFLAAIIAGSKGRNAVGWLLLGLLFPGIALVAALVIGPPQRVLVTLDQTPAGVPHVHMKKCPDCAEWVKADARLCRHCGFEFAERYADPRPARPAIDTSKWSKRDRERFEQTYRAPDRDVADEPEVIPPRRSARPPRA